MDFKGRVQTCYESLWILRVLYSDYRHAAPSPTFNNRGYLTEEKTVTSTCRDNGSVCMRVGPSLLNVYNIIRPAPA